MTGKMIFQITELWLYIMTYTRENKCKSRYSLKKGSSKFAREQQEYTVTQRKIMEKENYSRNNNVEMKQQTREDKPNEGDTTE